MKKIALLTGLYFTASALAFSQTNPGNEGPKLLNHIQTVCGLTPRQMEKLQPIVEKHAVILQADRKNLTGIKLQEACNIENTRFESQMKGVLTASQMKLYKNDAQ